MALKSTAEDKDIKTLKYDILAVKIDVNEKTISCKLKSQFPQRYDSKDHGDNPLVLLDLQNDDADGNRCFQIMKEIIHPNILQVKGINTVKSQLLLWVEPYTGNLFEHLGDEFLSSSTLPKSKSTVLPTQSIQKIISQIIDGLNHLRIQGSYHGNFTLEGTYYQRIKLDIIVKLTNFKEKGAKGSVCLYQLEDLKDLGTELTLLSSIADKLSKKSQTHTFDTFILDDLANKLKLVTQTNLDKSYEVIKKHPFFWKVHERKRFFIYRVAVKMKDHNFRTKVMNCTYLCSLRWDTDNHCGLLQIANHFRGTAYDGRSRCEFVLFICSLYAHEHEPPLSTSGKNVEESAVSRRRAAWRMTARSETVKTAASSVRQFRQFRQKRGRREKAAAHLNGSPTS